MSTTTQPLKYRFTAEFPEHNNIVQPKDDRYSKHDESADWNPSAFRDVLDRGEQPLEFYLFNDDEDEARGVDLVNGLFYTWNPEGQITFSLEDEPLTDRKLIYYREMYQQSELGKEVGEPFVNRYVIGYEGKNSKEQIEKKIIYLSA